MVGQTLGHYKILDRLGAGGMGEVYRAEDATLKRQVALKVLPPDLGESRERLERFRREAEALAVLDHPGIVTIHTVEEVDGVRFLTMQLVEGRPLAERIPGGGMPLERIFDLAIPLADALAAAHEKGVVHRDLKPANIMVTDDGRVMVLDFGLAKLWRETPPLEATALPTEPLTEEGRVVGTMPYMSPEQVEGRPVDARSDIFSLGAVLYEMATGRRPFQGDSSASLISSILRDRPRGVDTLRNDLPHHLARIVEHCLEKDPLRRFQTARDVHNELVTLRRELDSAVPAREGGRHRSRRPARVASLVALLLVIAAAGLFLMRGRSAPTTDERHIESLAVLPLENLMRDPEQEYFVDGMTEALITDLAKIRALKVISRTSVMPFKETGDPIPAIAEALGVDAVIEGSVLRVGNEVRITAQLIDGETDQHLWAESYTRELENVLALHGEIARAIAEEIEVTLTSAESGRLTAARRVDPEALQAYLKGQYFVNKRSKEGFDQALELFQQAIEIDPSYALAHAGLANTYNLLGEYGLWDSREAYAKAKSAALEAIEADQDLADAWTALAWVSLSADWDWTGSEQRFRRAIELNPSSALAHHWYAELLMYLGRHDEAVAEIRRAQELDPLSLIIHAVEGRVLHYARRYDQAITKLQQVVAMDPGFAMTHAYLGNVYCDKGMYQEAVSEWETAAALFGDDEPWRDNRAYDHLWQGREDRAREILEELKAEESPQPYVVALLSLALGDREEALAWLERGFDAHADGMRYLEVDPALDPLRDDPRFRDLLRRMGFPE